MHGGFSTTSCAGVRLSCGSYRIAPVAPFRRARRLLAVTFCATISLAISEAALAHAPTKASCTNPLCSFRKTLFADTRHVFEEPAHWKRSDRTPAIRNALLVAGTMALLDDPVREHVQDRRNRPSERIADRFEPFGAEYVAGVLAGFAVFGKLADRPQAVQTALDGTMSTIIAAGLVVPALKEITGRSRPRTDMGASDFHPFSGGVSFPSGHTAAAFALATTIARNNDRRWVKDVSYSVATLVGYARIDHDAHWLSDTMSGALIGMAVAKSVNRFNQERRPVAVSSVSTADGWGIAFSRNF